MKTRMSYKFETFASKVGRCKVLKIILRPIYEWYKKIFSNYRNKLFLENGERVLQEFSDTLNSINVNYSIFAGTLLGAVREKNFLSHDMDIDTCIFYKDYSNKIESSLQAAGFKLVRQYWVDNGLSGGEQTYQKDGVDIDVFYIYVDKDGTTYQCDFMHPDGTSNSYHAMETLGYVSVRRLNFPVKYSFVKLTLGRIEVQAIENYSEWLCHRYGNDYMTPNPKFRDKGDNPEIINWIEKKAIFTFNED